MEAYILKIACPNIGKEAGDYYNNEYGETTEQLVSKGIIEKEKNLTNNFMKITAIRKQIKVSKAGKPYISVGMKTDQHGEAWINGFGNKITKTWAVGTEIADDLVFNKEYNGKTSLQFEVGTKEDMLDIYNLPATVGFVLDLLKQNGQPQANSYNAPQVQAQATPATVTPPSSEDDIDPADIPF